MPDPDLTYLQDQLRRTQSENRSLRDEAILAAGGPGPHDPGVDATWRSSVDRALGELKGSLDGLRHSFAVLAGAVGLLATLMVGGFAFLGFQSAQLSTKIDAIGPRISDEAARTRQELIGIATAISNSITATRQMQPPMVVIPPAQPSQPTPQPPKQ
jgi:hypothetical protein